MKDINYLLFAVFMFSLVSCTPIAKEFYVSPTGNDDNPGTKSQPFLSFGKAKETVAKAIRKNDKNREIYVYFRGGKYFFEQTVVIDEEEFKSGKNKIIFSSYENEKPFFTSGKILEGWKKVGYEIPNLPEAAKGKIWEISIPDEVKGLSPRFLCNDTTSLTLALSEGLKTMEDDTVCNRFNDCDSYLSDENLSAFVYPKQYFREWENLNDID